MSNKKGTHHTEEAPAEGKDEVSSPPPHEPERRVDDPSLGLSCIIQGYAPVQADGWIRGMRFYFRARHTAWSFTACISHDIDPASMNPPKGATGFFTSDEFRGFYVEGEYGTESEASFMPYAVVERIIRECASRLLSDPDRDHKV